MVNMQGAIKMTPFWGSYILSTMMLEPEEKNSESEQKERETLKTLYEIIDDYVEQA